jgi:hypothetical protein
LKPGNRNLNSQKALFRLILKRYEGFDKNLGSAWGARRRPFILLTVEED